MLIAWIWLEGIGKFPPHPSAKKIWIPHSRLRRSWEIHFFCLGIRREFSNTSSPSLRHSYSPKCLDPGNDYSKSFSRVCGESFSGVHGDHEPRKWIYFCHFRGSWQSFSILLQIWILQVKCNLSIPLTQYKSPKNLILPRTQGMDLLWSFPGFVITNPGKDLRHKFIANLNSTG